MLVGTAGPDQVHPVPPPSVYPYGPTKTSVADLTRRHANRRNSMPSPSKTLACTLAGLILAASSTGCLIAAAAAGAGVTVAFVKGEYRVRLSAEPDQVSTAALAVLREMNLNIISEATTDIDAHIVARTSADKKVTINIKPESPGITLLIIRVATFGDEAFSHAIHSKIENKLRQQRGAQSPPAS